MKDVKEMKTITPPYPFEAYAHIVRPLTEEEGGGFLITFPDLPGCMSDGDTIEEAIENGRDAFLGWVSVQAELKREIPKPLWNPEEDRTLPLVASGKFVQRVSKTIHAQLVRQAQEEGVSLNTLVLMYITAGLEKGITVDMVKRFETKLDSVLTKLKDPVYYMPQRVPGPYRRETSSDSDYIGELEISGSDKKSQSGCDA